MHKLILALSMLFMARYGLAQYKILPSHNIPEGQFIFGGYDIHTGEFGFATASRDGLRGGGHAVLRDLLQFGGEVPEYGQGRIAGFGFVICGGKIYVNPYASLKAAGQGGSATGSTVNPRLPIVNPQWSAVLAKEYGMQILPQLAKELNMRIEIDPRVLDSEMFPFNFAKQKSPDGIELFSRQQMGWLREAVDLANSQFDEPEPFSREMGKMLDMKLSDIQEQLRQQKGVNRMGGPSPAGRGPLSPFMRGSPGETPFDYSGTRTTRPCGCSSGLNNISGYAGVVTSGLHIAGAVDRGEDPKLAVAVAVAPPVIYSTLRPTTQAAVGKVALVVEPAMWAMNGVWETGHAVFDEDGGQQYRKEKEWSQQPWGDDGKITFGSYMSAVGNSMGDPVGFVRAIGDIAGPTAKDAARAFEECDSAHRRITGRSLMSGPKF